MPKFILEETPEPEQPFVVSLVKEDDGVSVRLRQGQSENICILHFHNDGRIVRTIMHVCKRFHLQNIMGSSR